MFISPLLGTSSSHVIFFYLLFMVVISGVVFEDFANRGQTDIIIAAVLVTILSSTMVIKLGLMASPYGNIAMVIAEELKRGKT